jgi:hypothetical protein
LLARADEVIKWRGASSYRYWAAQQAAWLLATRASQRLFPVIGLLSSRPPFGRIGPAAEIGSHATYGRPSSKRSPISL